MESNFIVGSISFCCEHVRAAIYDKLSRVNGWTAMVDSGVSTTTTTGCKGSSLLWYRLPENAHTTTAAHCHCEKTEFSRILVRIESFLNLVFTANMRGFLFILSVVLTVCCYTANMFQKWQEDVIKEGLLGVAHAFTGIMITLLVFQAFPCFSFALGRRC